MKKVPSLLLCISLLAGFGGCKKKSDAPVVVVQTSETAPTPATKTLETSRLSGAIDDYMATPTAEQAAKVDEAIAKLDGEIAELKSRVASTSGSDQNEAQIKLDNLNSTRSQEVARFNAAKVANGMNVSVDTTRTGAEKVGATLDKAGDKVQDTAEKIGDTLKKGADNVGDKLKGN